MSLDDNDEKYTKRSGTLNFGEKYEIVFTIFLALQLCLDNRIQNFKISTNNIHWFDFDDVVFEIEFTEKNEYTKNIIFAIQLKHSKQNLTVQNLTNIKGDYSLTKYYASYKNIIEHYDTDFIKNCFLVLWTTGGFSKTIEDFSWRNYHVKKKISKGFDILPFITQIFQFISTESINKNKFFEKFYICVNQKNCKQLETEIRTLLLEFGNAEIYENLFSFMDKWMKGQLGSHYKLTRTEFIFELCEHLLSPFIPKPLFIDKNLKFLDLWNKSVESVNLTFIEDNVEIIWSAIIKKINVNQNWIEDNWTMTTINLPETTIDVPKKYFLSKAKTNKISLQNLYLIYWKCGHVPLFLKIDTFGIYFKRIFNLLQSINAKNYYVICTKKVPKLKKLCIFKSLCDLKDNIIDEIKSKLYIRIQNRFSISLKEMLEINGNLLENITTDLFLEMIKNDSVGVIDVKFPSFYIKRRISTSHLDLNVLKYIRNELVFILCDLNNHFEYLKNNFPSRVVEFIYSETDLSISEKNICVASYDISLELVKSFLSKFNSDYHVFILSEKLGCFLLKWLVTSGSINLLQKFITENGNVDNEDDLFPNMNNTINIISSPPGMGKSSLIDHISINCLDKIWITKINLIEYSKYFEDFLKQTKSVEKFLDHFYSNKNLDKFCFNFFIYSTKVVFLVDGFDEISPKFINPVFEIIEFLKNKNCVQWITTRPNLAYILEEKFNVLSYHICPFNPQEKITFIKQYCHSVSTNTEKSYTILFNFIKNLDTTFSGNALQMSMICNLLDNIITQKCKTINISNLYSNFINLKFTRYEQKYLTGCDPVICDDLTQKLREINTYNHQISSLIVIFGQEQALYFLKKSVINFLEEIKNGKEKTGIIIQISNENIPIFLHQTYAEYFAATWLAENFDSNKRAKKFLNQVFLSRNLSMVRLFFDRILSQGLDLFEAVLDQDFDRIKLFLDRFKCLDRLGRNALHLACSWKPKKLIIYLDLLLQKFHPNNERDTFFNKNAIEYADLTKNVVAIDKILQTYDFDITRLSICSNVKWLIHKCIKKKCITLLTKFCDYLNKLQDWAISDDFDNLLFTAIETNNLELIQILLSIDKFKKYIKHSKTHGNAALQFAILLGNENIAEKLVNFCYSDRNKRLSAYQIAVEESNEDIKKILKTI